MATYVVLTKLTSAGRKSVNEDPGRLAVVRAQAERCGVQVRQQYATLGAYDFVTVIEAPDNAAVSRVSAEISAIGTTVLAALPAIGLQRFTELLQIQPYRTEPHRWQTAPWARLLRRAGRYFVSTRYVRRYCRPFEIEGGEQLRDFRGPAIVIANHSSHFDTPAVLSALPERITGKILIAAAADKFYASRKKRTWWYSLFHGTFPVARGGGTKQLEYPLSLLRGGWSILIYPEGGRSRSGQVQRFRHGVAIMAMRARCPVIPVYIEGLRDVMPKGQRTPRPAAVSARIGPPVSLAGVASIPEGTALLENALRTLAGLPPHHAAAPSAEPALASGG
ncbi:MAG: GYD domain-containing protein [Dehalococcoidia bacterium]|nr:GYD domain-containing protein [Dehalococcoidia bacterium]